MSGARRSTVYDLSSLRLRPDGTRIQRSASANHSLRYAAVAVQDSRGNWFAQDASGSRTVAKYRRVRQDVDGEPVEPQEEPVPTLAAKGKGKTKTGTRYDPRPLKRRKFMNDFDFIVPEASTSAQSLPSSDLLKAIHYFASQYYHERGQLLNVTKEYRHMRKVNKLLRLEQQKRAKTAHEGSEDEVDAEPTKPVRRGGRIKGKGKATYPTDMYRILDGSALLAIGMLLEEYVAKTLEVRIPDGWEEMMQQAGARDEDIDIGSDGGEDSIQGMDAYVGNHEEVQSSSPVDDSSDDDGAEVESDREEQEASDNRLYEVEEIGGQNQ